MHARSPQLSSNVITRKHFRAISRQTGSMSEGINSNFASGRMIIPLPDDVNDKGFDFDSGSQARVGPQVIYRSVRFHYQSYYYASNPQDRPRSSNSDSAAVIILPTDSGTTWKWLHYWVCTNKKRYWFSGPIDNQIETYVPFRVVLLCFAATAPDGRYMSEAFEDDRRKAIERPSSFPFGAPLCQVVREAIMQKLCGRALDLFSGTPTRRCWFRPRAINESASCWCVSI